MSPATNQEDDDALGDRRPRYQRNHAPLKLSPGDYTVGWICALHHEMAAAKAMMDECHENPTQQPSDSNTYICGEVGLHNVVIACLPHRGYGTNSAATVAANMLRSFPNIRVGLMVGVGGGVPSKEDVRLGDVVVGDEVIQYDLGKTIQDGRFEQTKTLNKPPQLLLTAISRLQAESPTGAKEISHTLSVARERHSWMASYTHPQLPDNLFDASYDHEDSSETCDLCDQSKLVPRRQRPANDPEVHYGGIASGNQVMRHAKTRDRLAQDHSRHRILCFEMEAAGLMDSFPCLVIRGICDYSDSHKNKQWQKYAATTAAAYAKELLLVLPQIQVHVEIIRTRDQKTSTRRREELLQSLEFEQMEARHKTIKHAHSETCRWFLDHPAFHDWIDPAQYPDHHGFLWISGKPGAGKSTLVDFAFRHALMGFSTETAIVAFFFNGRGDELEKSTQGLYRHLLLQLLRRHQDLQSILDNPELDRWIHSPNVAWEVQILQELLSRAIQKLGQRQLTCFIDALDECDRDEVQEMVEYFELLGQEAARHQVRLYICFSSRHYPYLDIQKRRKVILEDQEGHAADLTRYVESKLRVGTSKAATDIKAAILEKAAGVFMWIILAVKILNDEYGEGRWFAMFDRLDKMPTELSELFTTILQRDSKNLDELLLCIQWILFAARPLTSEEYYYAMVAGLRPEGLSSRDPDNITLQDMERFVLSSSKGLAEVTKSDSPTVQFIHESVRDFLIKDKRVGDIWPEHSLDFESSSHNRLKECCLAYMNILSREHVPFIPRINQSHVRLFGLNKWYEFPFIHYTCDHIFEHAEKAAVTWPQESFIRKLTIDYAPYFKSYDLSDPDGEPVDPLYIFASMGAVRLMRTKLSYDPRCHPKGGFWGYPLLTALANRHKEAVRVLLLESITPCQVDHIMKKIDFDFEKLILSNSGQSPVHWAAARGFATLVDSLIKSQDLELDAQDSKHRTPLYLAAKSGHWGAIRSLILTGKVNVNHKDRVFRTPLSIAAGQGHYDAVQLLVAAENVALNHEDIHGRTPLSFAAEYGHYHVVRLLLTADGVDPEMHDLSYGLTPLLWAVLRGHYAIVKMLLNTSGVNINHQSYGGMTPLSLASSRGHREVVRLLLAADGIQPNPKTNGNMTPLSLASTAGHVDIVKLLLAANGIDANSQDNSGMTPLSLASESGHEEVVLLLLATGRSDPNITNWSGLSALSFAAMAGNTSILAILLSSHNVMVDIQDRSGRTPLSLAAEYGHLYVVRLLLDTGVVDPDLRDTDDGRTPLSWASKEGHTDVVRQLLSTGMVDPDSRDTWGGRTPLSWAAEYGHLGVIRLLLDTGAVDLHSVDTIHGLTPASWAARRGHVAAVHLLL